MSILIASVLTEALQVHGINNAYKVSEDVYLLLSRTDTMWSDNKTMRVTGSVIGFLSELEDMRAR